MHGYPRMSIAVAFSAFERSASSLSGRGSGAGKTGHCDCGAGHGGRGGATPEVRTTDAAFSNSARARLDAGSARFPQRIERPDGAAASVHTRTASVANSLAFEVVTRDGDRVQVRLDSVDSSSSSRLDVRTAEGSLRARSEERSSSRSVSIAIEGELDDSERAAIDALASDVVALANDFIEGDDAAALRRAQSLQLDDSLASFSLQLAQRSERTVQTAGYRGEHGLAALARADAGFAATVDALAGKLREFVLAPPPREAPAIDKGTRAQLLAGLLPSLFEPLDAALESSAADA